jgi:predicted CXXCH cytochrome family protein
VQCTKCHINGYSGTPKTCISCHQTQYNNAPSHITNKYPTDCTQCHGSTNWLATSFDHKLTNFPLTGAHTSVLCTACHTNGYKGTPTTCNSCHITKYNSAVTPNHLAAGISTTCTTCHTTTAWKPSTFSHTTTGYQLLGAHKNIVQCSDCHKGSTSIAPLTCIGCHQTNYNNAANHKSQGYPTDCSICHSQNNWLESTFNHATTKFPLTGAHKTVLCALCHTTKFTGTTTDCYTCHTAKYNNSTNPNHLSAKFPTTCQTCHTTTAWTPANYNHDAQYFPIYSGKHKGAWTLCSECHVTSNYATFNCLLCHAHSNKTSVDSKHNGVKNYSYVSTACYSCHPQGRSN